MADPINSINSINPLMKIEGISSPKVQKIGGDQVSQEFMKVLEEALNATNNDIKEAEGLADDFSMGRISSIHDVIVSAEKASMSLRLTMEVRNRIVDSFREIMRMQL